MAGRHQLAAIVFSDAVGSSQSMRENEDRTLALLADDFMVMRELCEKHAGKAHKSTGDGLMMVFPGAGDAVRCALEIQERLGEPDKGGLAHRIGIHLGDVYLSDGDAHGDGVNVAFRLQELATPGGIVLSRVAYDVVKSKLGITPRSLGPRALKGISEPIDAYEITPRGKVAPNRKGLKQGRPAVPWAWASFSFCIVALGVAAMHFRPWEERDSLPATIVVAPASHVRSAPASGVQEPKSNLGETQSKHADPPPSGNVTLGPISVPTGGDPSLRDQDADKLASQAANQGDSAINVAQEEIKRASLAGYTEESEKRWAARDFSGMATWIGDQPWASSPDGQEAKLRWTQMADFKEWYQSQMRLYTKERPLIVGANGMGRPMQSWMTADGAFAFQFSQGTPRSFTFDQLPVRFIGMTYPALLEDTPDPTKVAAEYTALDTESNVQRDVARGATPVKK
jgi:class 3 adenylate cyclase